VLGLKLTMSLMCPPKCRPGILPAASGRRLLWDPPATTATNFTSYWVQADKAYCANESLAGGFPPWYFVGEGGFGQLVTDSGVCNRNFLNGNSWVSNAENGCVTCYGVPHAVHNSSVQDAASDVHASGSGSCVQGFIEHSTRGP
jgi:hypothetical protein